MAHQNWMAQVSVFRLARYDSKEILERLGQHLAGRDGIHIR
jgi:hypothetical protein